MCIRDRYYASYEGALGPDLALAGDPQVRLLAGRYAMEAITTSILAFKNTLDLFAIDLEFERCAVAKYARGM